MMLVGMEIPTVDVKRSKEHMRVLLQALGRIGISTDCGLAHAVDASLFEPDFLAC